MALISLGKFNVSTPYQWIPFNPVELSRASTYALYVSISSPSFAEIYSTFSFRLRGEIRNGLFSTSEPFSLAQGIPDIQVIRLTIGQYWNDKEPLIIECRRNFFFSQQSNLADTIVELQIDPTEDYKL